MVSSRRGSTVSAASGPVARVQSAVSRAEGLAVLVMAVVTASLLVVGAQSAHAVTTRYFACPIPVAGAGCGISGSVGPGKYLAEFKFATSRGYDFEPFIESCQASCPVFHWAVGRDDRTPAGYQITSDSPFVLGRMLP